MCSLKEKITFILQATYQHAKNLALLTALYRVLMAVLCKVQGGKRGWHTLLCGFISGYVVFGEENKVNTQVSVSREC